MSRYSNSQYYQMKQLGQTDPTPKYYVYLLVDPIDNEIFYVGKGCRDRALHHVRDVKRGKLCNGINGKLFRRLQGILATGKEPIIEKPDKDLSEINALALEAAFIDYHGLDNLCNYQASGFGCTNHTPEMKKKISDIVKVKMAALPMSQSIRTHLSNHGGSFVNLFEYLYQKKCQESIKKFTDVHMSFLKQLAVEQKEYIKNNRVLLRQHEDGFLTEVMKSRLITKCNKATGEFVRLCPRCKKELIYESYHSLMSTARKSNGCIECMGKDNAERHNKMTPEQKQLISERGKKSWSSLSKQEQERIKNCGRSHKLLP